MTFNNRSNVRNYEERTELVWVTLTMILNYRQGELAISEWGEDRCTRPY